ncbi:hypothetical protein ACNKHQ_02910 [Shigella flexneri]
MGRQWRMAKQRMMTAEGKEGSVNAPEIAAEQLELNAAATCTSVARLRRAAGLFLLRQRRQRQRFTIQFTVGAQRQCAQL